MKSNRYTVVKPQDSDLAGSDQSHSVTERSGFSESVISDQWGEDSYSSNSSYVVDSQITTSAEKSQNQTRMRAAKRAKRKLRAFQNHQKEQPVYCSSCMQRLQPYECAMNFQYQQREFERNMILQSFQQLSHESQQRSKPHKVRKQRRYNNITDDLTGASCASSQESKETFQTS